MPLAFTQDDFLVYIAHGVNVVGKEIVMMIHGSPLSATPTTVFILFADHTARIWWGENGTCLLQYVGHNGSVNSLRFHPTQDYVLTASGDQTAHVWKPQISLPPHIDTLVSQIPLPPHIDTLVSQI